MQSKLLFAGIALCLLLINPIPILCELASCKHYQDRDDTAHPLDICTAQSIKGVITSTKTICDSKSMSLLYQTFSGADCSDSNLQSQEILGADQYSSSLCDGNNCAVSFRSYSSNDCDSSFQDFAFVRGISYSESSSICTMYDCTSIENVKYITISDCSSNSTDIKNIYYGSNDCQILPLYCGSISYLFPNTSTVTDLNETKQNNTLHSGLSASSYTVSTLQYEIRIYALPATIIQSICLMITFLILFSVIYSFCCNKKTAKQMAVKLKLCVMSSIIFNIFGIMCIMHMTSTIMAHKFVGDEDRHSITIIPYYGTVIGYVGGKSCLEMFFILRVYMAFQSSLFYLSKRCCVLLFIWMIIISLIWVVLFIMDQESIHFMYMANCVFESIFIVTLLCLFINRLQKLVALDTPGPTPSKSIISINMTQSKTDTVSVSIPVKEMDLERACVNRWRYICCTVRADIRSTKSNFSSQTSSLIYLMTRCVLLSSISLITTGIFGMFLSIKASLNIQSVFILYAMWSIDIGINSFCLYLNFTFTDVFYKKCCILCHRSCQNMLEYISASKIVHDDAVKSLSDLRKDRTISL